ncbi:MAG: hypothetical protein KC474_04985 [Cyanobacteria bacterium HKST-UBA04]|nr:hypothetical protein [Cyanobacteria bacterium HKST-UBA04]MCA9841305.1 hypothetical protein [Cyanobacteria bacterium HKST-UBA03]
MMPVSAFTTTQSALSTRPFAWQQKKHQPAFGLTFNFLPFEPVASNKGEASKPEAAPIWAQARQNLIRWVEGLLTAPADEKTTRSAASLIVADLASPPTELVGDERLHPQIPHFVLWQLFSDPRAKDICIDILPWHRQGFNHFRAFVPHDPDKHLFFTVDQAVNSLSDTRVFLQEIARRLSVALYLHHGETDEPRLTFGPGPSGENNEGHPENP